MLTPEIIRRHMDPHDIAERERAAAVCNAYLDACEALDKDKRNVKLQEERDAAHKAYIDDGCYSMATNNEETAVDRCAACDVPLYEHDQVFEHMATGRKILASAVMNVAHLGDGEDADHPFGELDEEEEDEEETEDARH